MRDESDNRPVDYDNLNLVDAIAEHDDPMLVQELLEKLGENRNPPPPFWAEDEEEGPKLMTYLHVAAISNASLPVFKLLLHAGEDVNAGTEDGDKPIHFAASEVEDPLVFHELYGANADLDELGSNGWSPLETAIRNNRNAKAIAWTLIQLGANTDLPGGYTAYDLMKRFKTLEEG